MTTANNDSLTPMEAGAAIAASFGMVQVEDPSTLQEGQQILIVTPAGAPEFGTVSIEMEFIESHLWRAYRGATGSPFYGETYDYSPDTAPHRGEAFDSHSFLPEGSVIYAKPEN